jgi:hypothetical protein
MNEPSSAVAATDVRAAFEWLRSVVHKDAGQRAEIKLAEAEFFGSGARVPQSPNARGRFEEWFLLERVSAPGATTLAARISDDAGGSLPPRRKEALACWLRSTVGVFEVVGTGGASPVSVVELISNRLLTVMPPRGVELTKGVSLVGRLIPLSTELHVCAESVGVHRGEALARAFRVDLERNLRGGLSRRLSQLELERVLWSQVEVAAEAPVHLEELLAELERMLKAAGVDEVMVPDVVDAMRHAERPGEVLGPLLERLAFESPIDLDALQRLLLELWNAVRGDRDVPVATGGAQPRGTGAGRLKRPLSPPVQSVINSPAALKISTRPRS